MVWCEVSFLHEIGACCSEIFNGKRRASRIFFACNPRTMHRVRTYAASRKGESVSERTLRPPPIASQITSTDPSMTGPDFPSNFASMHANNDARAEVSERRNSKRTVAGFRLEMRWLLIFQESRFIWVPQSRNWSLANWLHLKNQLLLGVDTF